MNSFKQVFILLAILLLVPLSSYGDEERYDLPIEGSPSIGPENAPLTIIEFLDYQ